MIKNILFCNISSVNSQQLFKRVIDLKKTYHFAFIALVEYFQDPGDI